MRSFSACLAIATCFLLCPSSLGAQTFNGAGSPIPADGSILDIPLAVIGLAEPLNSSSFGLEQVCFTIEHAWIGDLEISIVAPDGTARLLASGLGDSNDEYANTCFRQDATTPIMQGAPPFSGTYRPQQDIGIINNGQDGNGVWKLRVVDTYPWSDNGSVIAWSLSFGDQPAVPFNFQSSNLPIVVINTNGQDIPDGQRITASMGVVYNGPGILNFPYPPFTDYDGPIGIKVRGNTSNYLSPKKSYTVELRDDLGEDFNAPLLGMPSESDWVLVANYFDKSLMNNTLSYHLARAMGMYAPRQRNVEVVINGEYVGVYALVEQIKRDPNRVDIAKLTPDETIGDDLTGGYILRVDRFDGPDNGFFSPYPAAVSNAGQEIYYEYRYPKPENIAPEQKAYIQAYVDSFETAMASTDFADPTIGFRAFAEEASFVDLFVINEISRNLDGYRLSSYLYKDKNSNGGKLQAGPPWDFDIAWGNANYCDGSEPSGWAYQFGDVCPGDQLQLPFWWPRLMEDSTFVDAVRCRWNELRDNVLSPAYVNAYCDSVAAQLDEAQQRNFTVWPILGSYVWPNPFPLPTTYAGEVQELKDFMNARWAWMDLNLPGTCLATGIDQAVTATLEAPFPNPFANEVLFRTTIEEEVRVRIIDPLGRTILNAGPISGRGILHRIEIPADLASGTYLLIGTTRSGGHSAYRLQH